MKAARVLLLSMLLALSTVTASQHSVNARSNRSHLAARSPQIFPFFGDGSDTSTSASGSGSSASGSASAAAAASSSSAAAAASSSLASLASAAAASASRAAAAASSSIAAAAASSAAASMSQAAAESASAAASRSSAAAAASASRASASLASASLTATTDSAGLTTTLTATVQATASVSTPTSSATSAAASSSSSGSSNTGLIIGVSVAGGVVVLALIGFLLFKFCRKNTFDDPDADIKWPELKTDPDSNVMQPLPARRTGGAGFDMGDESDNEGMEGQEKGRESFSGSGTALTGAPANTGYGVADYPPGVEHGYGMDPQSNPYYAGHDMYGQTQYGMQMQQGAGHYSDGGNAYGTDPYSHSGMSHPQNNGQYPSHGYS